MARLASITLILNAHQTGARHLHETLLSVQSRLAAEGVGVIGALEVRQRLRLSLQPENRSEAEGTALTRAALTQLCPNTRHIVILPENPFGTTARAQLLGDKALIYPFAARRLREMLAAFGGAEVRVGLAIRNPATFLPACWAEQLRQGPWQSFADYAAGIPPATPRWLWLVHRILQATPSLTLWKFEDYPAVLPQIIDWATGLDGFGATVTPYDLPARPGLTQRAADYVQGKMAVTPTRNHRALLRKMRAADAAVGDLPPFDPWSTADRAILDAGYAEDMLQVSLSSRVNWLTPA